MDATPLCAVCGAPFTIKRRYRWPQLYCSKPCRDKASQANRKPGDRHKPRYADCPMCGERFTQTNNGGGATARWSVHCSRACAKRSTCVGKSTPIPWVQCSECKRWFVGIRKRLTCGPECSEVRGRRRFQETWVSVRATNPTVQKTCKECGEVYSVNYYADVREFCSTRCTVRYTKRQRRRYEQASKRGKRAGVVIERERFKDVEIFERDGWRCQLCSKPTNRVYSRRDMLSPTLDHIIPISQGGGHIRSNVQLAHLICNSRKADGGIGQPRLPI